MIKNEKITYSYTFEDKDRFIVKDWCKTNKVKERDLCKKIGISYIHFSRILHGKRTASSLVRNRLRKLGVWV